MKLLIVKQIKEIDKSEGDILDLHRCAAGKFRFIEVTICAKCLAAAKIFRSACKSVDAIVDQVLEMTDLLDGSRLTRFRRRTR